MQLDNERSVMLCPPCLLQRTEGMESARNGLDFARGKWDRGQGISYFPAGNAAEGCGTSDW